MKRTLWLLLCGCLLLLKAGVALAAIDFTDCREETSLLRSLERERAEINAQQRVFDAIYSDQFPADLSLAQAVAQTSAQLQQGRWPEQIDCPSLEDQYQSARAGLLRAQQRLGRQQAVWLDQPDAARDALSRVWQSRQRLTSQAQALRAATGADHGSASLVARNTAEQVQRQLSELRREFFTQLSALHHEATPGRIAELLSLWSTAYEIRPLSQMPEAEILLALSADQQQLLSDFFRLAQHDVLVQRNAINDVRSWLWQEHASAFAQLDARATSDLLARELRAFTTRLRWLLSDVQLSYRHTSGDSGITSLWATAGEYLLGALAAVVLVLLARGSARPAAQL
ncbi:MAG: hypothetical protein V7756_02290 [Halopseudomonas sp.]|uniref:hypothetical protein n=1 Tax=Halopseudomonas sp. TaxID=2901191 RepID=UPI00300168E1